jgi:undecaprenyl-diphosphatase
LNRGRQVWNRLVGIRGIQSILFLSVSGILFLSITLALRLPATATVDLDFTHSLQSCRSPGLDALFFTLSFLGNAVTLAGLVVAAALVFIFRRERRLAYICLLSLLGLPVNELLKWIVDRPRPLESQVMILMERTGLSFPSGHSMGSAVVFGLFACLFWLNGKPNRWWRYAGTIFFGILPFGIGLSRIYVGAHWLSDVLAGLTAGTFPSLLWSPCISAGIQQKRLTLVYLIN